MNENDIKKLQEAYTLRGIAIHQLHERVASLEGENARLKELYAYNRNAYLARKVRQVIVFLVHCQLKFQASMLLLNPKQLQSQHILAKFHRAVNDKSIIINCQNILLYMICLSPKKIAPRAARQCISLIQINRSN